MRAVDFAVSQILPEDLRQETYDLGKKGIANLMAQVATKYPEQFPEITKKLGDLGRRASWLQGYSSRSADTRQVIDTKKYYAQMDAEIAHLRKEKLPPDEFDDRRADIYTRYSDLIERDTMTAAMKNKNAFAMAVASGARGNASHVKAIVSTPGVFQDSKGKVIPMFVRNSFGDGVRPAETLAGTYGARTSVVSTKKATAKGGDLLKIMTQSTSHYNIGEKDCGVKNGIAFEPDDASLAGRVLARDAGDTPAGTVIDRQLLSRLRRRGKPVVARSAMTCRAKHGMCAQCAGLKADGQFPNVGESVGVTAAAALGEPIVQGALNVKHCLAEGTLVRMADFSIRRIQDVRLGEWVLGADIHGNAFPVEVMDVVDQGEQEVNIYSYKMGQTEERIAVVCTDNHQILQTTYYTGCADESLNYTPRKLPAGRVPGRPSAVLPKETGGGGRGETLAQVVGYYMGDGIRWNSTPKNGSTAQITVSCADTPTERDLQTQLGLVDMKMVKCQRSHDWRIVRSVNRGQRNAFKDLVARLGLDNLYCHEKHLPDEVWTWDDPSVYALIAGFVAADGSTYRSGTTVGVSFASTARGMLEGLRELLRVRCCIYACPTTKTASAGQGNYTHDMWAFTITRRDQVQMFADMIAPHIPGEKGRKLLGYLREATPSHYGKQPFYKAKREAVRAAGTVQCWDLSVNHPDELFVLANSLIVKNTGGMVKGKKSFSGLNYISQFVQIPEEFKDRAAVSEVDGTVEKVEEAPQGGTLITVNGEQHFAQQGFTPLVKVGQRVEAGDQLSDGLINPADVVRLRGLGAGRKYYADRLAGILRDSGQDPDPRNVEILARAAVDNYMVTDPEEEDPWLPDELVRESEFLANYKPPKNTSDMVTAKAAGKYLQAPALQYSVGTRLTPTMLAEIKGAGFDTVSVSKDAPAFRPEMKRLRTASHDTRDWMQGLATSYLGAQTRTALERGDETDVESNTHYAPRLAFGSNFGKDIETTGKF